MSWKKMSISKISFLLLVGLFAWNAIAGEVIETLDSQIPFSVCFEKAASNYGIDVFLLAAIASQESAFNAHAINENTNGTRDYGVMQINSSWLDQLSKRGITKAVLMENPCVNIEVGAWILAVEFYESGVSWDAVGAYNAGRRSSFNQALKRYKYSSKIYDRYIELRQKHSMDVVVVTARKMQPQPEDKYFELLAQTTN